MPRTGLDVGLENPDIKLVMTGTQRISGAPAGLATQILRGLFITAAAIGGLFMLVVSATVAFFIVCGIVLVALAAFAFLWGRAKLFGEKFGPQAQFEKARAEMEAQFKSHGFSKDGPVIDAHRTPDGWTVDD